MPFLFPARREMPPLLPVLSAPAPRSSPPLCARSASCVPNHGRVMHPVSPFGVDVCGLREHIADAHRWMREVADVDGELETYPKDGKK